jgi:hypothetical protein
MYKVRALGAMDWNSGASRSWVWTICMSSERAALRLAMDCTVVLSLRSKTLKPSTMVPKARTPQKNATN